MQSRATRFLTGPTGGMLVTALSLFTGLLGSVWSSDITEAARHGPAAPHFDHLLAFSYCFALSALGFFLRQKFLDQARDAAQSSLEASQKRLESASQEIPELVRTLPPREFLADFGIIFEKSLVLAAMSQADESPSRDQILESITILIEGIATLASKFDAGISETTYGANVMAFVDHKDAEPWSRNVKFIDDGVSIQNLRGLLIGPRAFSATSKGGSDSAIPELALPVPTSEGVDPQTGGTGWRVLPGAPMSFSRRRFEFFADTGTVGQWCRKFGDFKEHVTRQLEGYFAASSDHIQGFLSVPLFVPSAEYQENEHRHVVAVLNVHWSESRRFRYAEAAENFSGAIAPLRALLALELVRLKERFGWPPPNDESSGRLSDSGKVGVNDR
jgi:hypothetical protein